MSMTRCRLQLRWRIVTSNSAVHNTTNEGHNFDAKRHPPKNFDVLVWEVLSAWRIVHHASRIRLRACIKRAPV